MLLISSRTNRLKWSRMSCRSGRFLSLSLSRYWRAPSMYSTNVLFRQCSSCSITPESLKYQISSILSQFGTLLLLNEWNNLHQQRNIFTNMSLIYYIKVSSQTLTLGQMSCWLPSAQRYERVGLGEHPFSSAVWSCPPSCQWPPSGSPPTHQSAP